MKYVVLFLLLCTKAVAQQAGYLVYLVKGDVTVKAGKTTPKPVKQNQFIVPSDVVNLSSTAELTLADKDGNTFVLNSPGKYSGAGLVKQKKTTNSLTQKYLGLLYNELLAPNHNYNKFHKNNLAGVWGGVNRGDCDNLLFPAKGMKMSGEAFLFAWKKTSPANEYLLKIYDSTAKELVSLVALDTAMTVKIEGLAPGKYYWRIEGKNGDCEEERPLLFEIIPAEEEGRKISMMTKEASGLADRLAAIEQLNNEGYITAAQKYFQTLISENGNNASLVKIYTLFLLKHHLNKEAQKVWEEKFGIQQ